VISSLQVFQQKLARLWSSRNNFIASISYIAAYWEESPSKYSSWADIHFWNSCCGTAFSAIFCLSMSWNLCPLKAHFIFGNSQKSFRATSGELGGCVFQFSNQFLGDILLHRKRHVSWSIVIVENQIAGPKFGPFLRRVSSNCFSISMGVCYLTWNRSILPL